MVDGFAKGLYSGLVEDCFRLRSRQEQPRQERSHLGNDGEDLRLALFPSSEQRRSSDDSQQQWYPHAKADTEADPQMTPCTVQPTGIRAMASLPVLLHTQHCTSCIP